jgi:hypothetical protein
MFQINRLRLEIRTTDINPDDIYGFDIPFSAGLNIIAGENTRGKTTISSSIFYALGMEELLGGVNDKALGKALKSHFDTFDQTINDWKNHTIFSSKIFIEITNDLGQIFTLRRIIKSGDPDQRINQAKTKKINVYECSLDKLSKDVKHYPLFLRADNNNEDDYGFYFWFARTIGIELPVVTNSNNKEGFSPLYLQIIFSALFIEQTRGWSGFLANIPFFGVPLSKEKTVAFLLDLKELYVNSEIERLNLVGKELEEEWKTIFNKIEVLSAEYNLHVINVSPTILSDKAELDFSSLEVYDENRENVTSITNLIDSTNLEIIASNQIPIKKVGENKIVLREKLEKLYSDQIEFSKKFENFDIKLNLQKKQKNDIAQQLDTVSAELSKNKGVQNIIEEAVVENIYDNCPKCNQKVSKDLMFNGEVEISRLTLTENIAYLSGQQRIIKSSLNSLIQVIEEKNIMRKYFLKKQRDFEEEIKLVLQELITDDRDYSVTETLKKVRLENKINELKYLNEKFNENIRLLQQLADQYKVLLVSKEEAKESFQDDEVILNKFESFFKEKLLFKLGYESNSSYNVYIQKQSPFKYFPVYKNSPEDSFAQPIKANSSASDFVRTIWAYTLALLIGKNNPGVIIFDEPGQHKMSSDSLQKLFEICAQIKKHQIIIFTSVDTVLTNKVGREEKLDLDNLLINLTLGRDYNLYKIQKGSKSINLINSI